MPTDSPEPTISQRGRWAATGCAALCAGGSTAGLLAVIREATLHTGQPWHALACVVLAVCAGGILGLWLPRQVLQRRLIAENAPGAAPAPRVELEFAASLTGGLLIGFGLTWLITCAAAVGTESWRALLVRHFSWPPSLVRVAVLTPLCAILLLTAVVGAATLMALRGWLRLFPKATSRPPMVWTASLAAAAVASGLSIPVTDVRILLVAAPLSIFAAGAVAVHRRLPGVGAVPAAQAAAGGQRLPLMAAATGVALLSPAWAVVLAIPGEAWDTTSWGFAGTALAGAALIGLLAASRLVPKPYDTRTMTLGFLLSAAVWAFSGQCDISPAAIALLRVAALAFCGSACALSALQRLAASSGDGQREFARRLGAVTAGVGLLLLAGMILRAHAGPGAVSLLGMLVTTLAACAALSADTALTGGRRLASCALMCAWLAIALLLGRFDPGKIDSRPQSRLVDPSNLATRSARDLYAGAGRVAACGTGWEDPVADLVPAWDADLRGQRYAVVVLTGRTLTASDGDPNPRLTRRLVKRCATALLANGRLVIEQPDAAISPATLAAIHELRRNHAWRTYLLTASGPTEAYAALLAGSDIPDWVARHSWPQPLSVSLEPVENGRIDQRRPVLATRPGPR